MMTNKSVKLTRHYGVRDLYNDRTSSALLILAGVGFGKTTSGIDLMERSRTLNPASDEFLIIAPTYKLLKQRCFSDYRKHLLRIGLVEKRDFFLNKSEPRITFPETSKHTEQHLIGISGDNPDAIVSYNSAAAWVDEAALCVEDVHKNIVQRNRCPKAKFRQRIYTSVPIGLNWLYEVFNPEKLEWTSDVHERSKSKHVLHGTSFDNPYLDDIYLKELQDEFGWDTAYFDNYVRGLWVNLAKDTFYFSFVESKYVDDYPFVPDIQTMYQCWDSNVGQMTWTVIQNVAGQYRVTDENGSNGRNIEHACEQFITRFPPEKFQRYHIVVLGDASLHARSPHSYQTGYQMIESILRPHYPLLEVRAHYGNPFVEERSRCTNGLFAKGKLVVNRTCRNVIKSAKMSESDGKGGIRKKSVDTVTHAMESVDMGLIVLEPSKLKNSGKSEGARW